MGAPRVEWLWSGLILAAFVVAHALAARGLSHVYPWSWSWSELLIDYQGGFVKRGLLGEVAYRLRDTVSVRHLVVGVVFTAYALTSAGLILSLRLPAEFPGLLFLMSPAGWLFPLLNPAAYGRKDVFVVGATVASLTILRALNGRTAGLLATMAVFAVAGLLVEIAWFYYPLVFAALLAWWREESLRWKLQACAAASAYTLGCLLLTLRAPPVDTAAIAASWGHVPFVHDDTGALCCLNFGFASAVAVARATLPNLGGYALAAALGLLPMALLLAKRRPARMDRLTGAVAVAGILSAIFPAFVAADWGRYIYLWLSCAFPCAWVAFPPERARPRRLDPYGLAIKGALLAIYASSWQVLHYQSTDRSAFIPGILFRAMDASGITPRPN